MDNRQQRLFKINMWVGLPFATIMLGGGIALLVLLFLVGDADNRGRALIFLLIILASIFAVAFWVDYRINFSLRRKKKAMIAGVKQSLNLVRIASDCFVARNKSSSDYFLYYTPEYPIFNVDMLADLSNIKIRLNDGWQEFAFIERRRLRSSSNGTGVILELIAPLSERQAKAIATLASLSVAHPTEDTTWISANAHLKVKRASISSNSFILYGALILFFILLILATVAGAVASTLLPISEHTLTSLLTMIAVITLLPLLARIAYTRSRDKRVRAQIIKQPALQSIQGKVRATPLAEPFNITLLEHAQQDYLLYAFPIEDGADALVDTLELGIDNTTLRFPLFEHDYSLVRSKYGVERHANMLYRVSKGDLALLKRTKTVSLIQPQAYYPYAVETLSDKDWATRKSLLKILL